VEIIVIWKSEFKIKRILPQGAQRVCKGRKGFELKPDFKIRGAGLREWGVGSPRFAARECLVIG